MNFFKNNIVIFFILTATYSGAQTISAPDMPVDEVTKLITYREVVQEKGTADSLYIRGIAWINSFFKNPNEVTRVRDRGNAVIKGVHRFMLYYTDKDGNRRAYNYCEYSFALEFKDGRYRYTFTDFTRKEASRQPLELFLNKKDPAYNPQWEDYLSQVDKFARETAENLKLAMKPPVIRKDDW